MGHLALLDTLRDHAFTSGLTDHQIAKLAALATEVTFTENEVILADRQRSEYFYLVTKGSVNVQIHTASFTVSMVALGRGQAFGWSALLDHQDTLFQVRAREQTTALRIAGTDLTKACRKDGALGVEILLRILQVVAGRIQATEAKFAEMCGVPLKPERVPLLKRNTH
jgi:CRP-like cAMP-binding protein